MTETTGDHILLTELRNAIVDLQLQERVIDPEEAPALLAQLEATFVPEAVLAELDWDSLELAALLTHAEDRYGIDTSDVSVFDLFTVSDLLHELGVRIDRSRS